MEYDPSQGGVIRGLCDSGSWQEREKPRRGFYFSTLCTHLHHLVTHRTKGQVISVTWKMWLSPRNASLKCVACFIGMYFGMLTFDVATIGYLLLWKFIDGLWFIVNFLSWHFFIFQRYDFLTREKTNVCVWGLVGYRWGSRKQWLYNNINVTITWHTL